MPKIGRYGHAKQYKRMRKAIKQVKGFLGRVLRDIDRQVKRQALILTQKQEDTLNQAYRLLKQTRQSKNKLYSLHEPNVDCISKGKAHKRYEFGVKASIAVTAKESFIVGARSYPGNPYDGHTLKDQLQQVETLIGRKPETCFVDRGYKGSGVEEIKVLIAGQKRGVPKKEKNWMGRRNSVEPIIGHLKSDGKLRRCFLKGILGDAINVILSACGQNLRKLLKWLNFALIWGCFYSGMEWMQALLPRRLENEMAFWTKRHYSGTTKKIEKLLNLKPQLVLRLLKMINSAHYKRVSTISSVCHAITVLGLDKLKTLVTTLVLANDDPCKMILLPKILTRAAMCQKLAKHKFDSNPDEALIMGLFSLSRYYVKRKVSCDL